MRNNKNGQVTKFGLGQKKIWAHATSNVLVVVPGKCQRHVCLMMLTFADNWQSLACERKCFKIYS